MAPPADLSSPIISAHGLFRVGPTARTPTPDGTHMNERTGLEAELRRLERQVDDLLATLGALREENRALRNRQEHLSSERASLMQRNEQVRTRVEAMIGRLKTLEHGS
jgi:cell division protein ZapB